MNLRLAAYAGGIDKDEFVPELVVMGLDGVAGGSGYGSDDVAVGAQKSVCEAGFADVRLADDCYARQAGVGVVAIVFLLFREGSDDSVEQVAGSRSVGGGDAVDLAQSEGVELVGVKYLFARVHLVDAEYDRLFAAAQDIGYLGVVVGDSGCGLDHEEHKVSLVYRNLYLGAYGALEHVVGVGGVAAGIDNGKLASAPVAAAVMAVTGYSRRVIYNRLSHPYEAVEKCRFADVRPSDYCYEAHKILNVLMLVVQSAVLAGFASGPVALFFVKRGVLVLIAADTALAHLLV